MASGSTAIGGADRGLAGRQVVEDDHRVAAEHQDRPPHALGDPAVGRGRIDDHHALLLALPRFDDPRSAVSRAFAVDEGKGVVPGAAIEVTGVQQQHLAACVEHETA